VTQPALIEQTIAHTAVCQSSTMITQQQCFTCHWRRLFTEYKL